MQFYNPRRLPVPTKPLSEASRAILGKIDTNLENATKADFDRLNRQLERIPKEERTQDWIERKITIFAVTDTKLRRATSMLHTLFERCHDDESKAQFKKFNDQLNERIAPYLLTIHGKVLPFSEREPTPTLNALSEVFSFLDQHGYPAFVNSGTLLGAVREGGFLPHDDDVDLAVHIEGSTPEARNQSLRALAKLIDSSDLSETPVQLSRTGPMVKLTMRGGVGLDLFALWMNGDEVHIWPHTTGDLERNQVFPLSQTNLHGVQFPSPANPEAMLVINYGPEWPNPDSGFRFDWAAAKEKFEPEIAACRKARKRLGPSLKRLLGQGERP